MSWHDEEKAAGALDLELWRQLFAYTRPYRKQVVLICLAGVGTAAVDALYPLVTKALVDDIVARGAGVELLPYVAVYLGLTAAVAFFIWAFICLAGRIRTRASHDIRRDGFARLQELSFSFYDRRPVGWLMARMTSDCERLSNILAWGVLDAAWGFAIILGVTTVMFLLDAKLALVTLAILPVLGLASVFFRRRILDTARAVRLTNSRITASYNEGIMGVRTTKVFVREQRNLDDFQGLTGEMYRASVANALLSALYLPLVLALGSVATGLALAVGGFQVTAGRISIGTLLAFVTYSRYFFEPVNHLAMWFAEMQMAQASAERILGLIDTVPEIRDAPGLPPGGPDRIGEIEFRRVCFAYGDGPPVLTDFDLRVRPGETIALVGETGGGKTTIVNLLCRFYEPTSGEIRMDGVDTRSRRLHWLQSKLGIVLQEPQLFRGSILQNIRYGNLDATEEQVVAASKLVGAHDFVAEMEKGYSTQVGEDGVRLSTGQKQLVSLARAILAEPQILVMDEATSSVDTETEARIQRGLAHVLEGRTSFVIAHRLSTIRSADRILVVDGGKIVEEGDHKALLAERGRYHALYSQQSQRDSLRSWA